MERRIALDCVRPPTHPGAILREDVLPALGMTAATVAEHLHVSPHQVDALLAEQAGVTPEMALRLGKFCGNGPRLWLRMQETYDIWHVERRVGADISTIPTMAAE